MFKKGSQIYYSPSDLIRYMKSPFASWMDRYLIESSQPIYEKDPQDPILENLASKGLLHENQIIQKFESEGRQCKKSLSFDKGEFSTLSLVEQKVEIIYQAHLKKNNFEGQADFLVLQENGLYEVWDAKLALTPQPTFLIQLCCYSDMLTTIQKQKTQSFTVILGNNQQISYFFHDFYDYYRTLLNTFLKKQKQFSLEQFPDPSASTEWLNWSQTAESYLIQKDHLFQVAHIKKSQIKKLNKAQITTLKDLASTKKTYVQGLHLKTFQKLKEQAKIQLKSQNSSTPLYKVISPTLDSPISGLSLLPPHSPSDVFFDIEGFPLEEKGLEYLWGAVYYEPHSQKALFKDFWAHDSEEEKKAFSQFIQWVYQLWLKDPTMHIYHYANYEVAACKRLMGAYGVCEKEIDQLLRHHVFIDLYKIVKEGILLGEPRYSIKNIEKVYRSKRTTEVGNGGDSIIAYDTWRQNYQQGIEGRCWKTSPLLEQLRLYNKDDCFSTQELVIWLRKEQLKHQILFLDPNNSPETISKTDISKENTEIEKKRDSLLKKAKEEPHKEKASIIENLAWLLEYHRREKKPVYWKLFERLNLSDIELLDDIDCLACLERTNREPFKLTTRSKKMAYEYQFPEQDFKEGPSSFYLLNVEWKPNQRASITIDYENSHFKEKKVIILSTQVPPTSLSLIPKESLKTEILEKSIERVVDDYEKNNFEPKKSALFDFLMRSKPQIKGESPKDIAPINMPSDKRLKKIIHTIENLDNSYLTIQGPPGTGKSYTAQHIIAHLLQKGHRIGISSNSHKAILNLLFKTAHYCQKKHIEAHFFSSSKNNSEEFQSLNIQYTPNNKIDSILDDRCVIGTTAWGFARPELKNQFDYLFIDEAGQLSIAHLVAISQSTCNLILIGDQMQLGQPSQGSHPAESGLSLLDYLLHDQPVIPPDMGVLLNKTYRMHSNINNFISQHIYDNKLISDTKNDKRIIKAPPSPHKLSKESGILFIPIEHSGNTQSSNEEVKEIVNIAHHMLNRIFYTGNSLNPQRPIEWNDILFISPYNHQVNKLQSALGKQAKVGTVDRFQGQEAPIVIISMCSSSANESTHGINFLFDRQRINVALSRALSIAIVVAHPHLSQVHTNHIEQLRKLNLFTAITNRSPSNNT